MIDARPKPLIVVTGDRGSGKSMLAQTIGRELGYEVINLGDVLLAALRRHGSGSHLKDRAGIGPAFVRVFGDGAYARVLKRVSRHGVVLDGLRIASAIAVLRADHPDLLHVHRQRAMRIVRSPDDYRSELPLLESLADVSERPDEVTRPTPQRLTETLMREIVLQLALDDAAWLAASVTG